MHDTALKIGSLAIEIYAKPFSQILELGSYNVNGSLRIAAPATAAYLGVDIEAGPGVDQVVPPGAPLPFSDASFDMVIASSVLEHDPMFWATFLEMCRVTRPSGYVYINAPSNGVVHRYPEDHWRFYPDCGHALQRWVSSQGIAVELVESFIAERQSDIWNDFVAVFRRMPASEAAPIRSLNEAIMCTNVLEGDHKEFKRERLETEDMHLLNLANSDREKNIEYYTFAQRKVTELEVSLAEMADRLITAEREATRLRTKADIIEDRAECIRRDFDNQLHFLEAELEKTAMDRDHYRNLSFWLRDLSTFLTKPQPWKRAILPSIILQRWRARRMADAGLFNAHHYLTMYRDVADAGVPALYHYLAHGLDEGRCAPGTDKGPSSLKS